MAKRLQRSSKPIHALSLIISAVALTVVVLFLFPWLQATEDLSGIDIASRNIAITEQFPEGVVFIIPLVAGSILVQYYRRVRNTVRPRRRLTTALMLSIGLVATILWVRNYTLNAVDIYNTLLQNPITDELPIDPAFEVEQVERPAPELLSMGDVLRDDFTVELWLHLALAASLLFLPFLDSRPEADPPQF
ncbi:MAG: hypothetical protein H6673_12265 [Anaerolineales bacterium]|nr:hypothetical protein [Anaerolineales bacterium]